MSMRVENDYRSYKLEDLNVLMDKDSWQVIELMRKDIDFEKFIKSTSDMYMVYSIMREHFLFNNENVKISKAFINKTDNNNKYKLGDVIYFLDQSIHAMIHECNYYLIREEYLYIDNKDLIENIKTGKIELKKPELKQKEAVLVQKPVEIDDYLQVMTKTSDLYIKNAEILKEHLRNAYVEVTLYHTVKNKFTKEPVEIEIILKAFYRMVWMVNHKKASFENARKYCSKKFGVSQEILKSINATSSNLMGHKKDYLKNEKVS